MYEDEIEAQVERLIQLLDETVHRTRRSRRSLERELGLAHGYIGNLLRGRTELKVYHVLLLSKLLDLDPIDLLRRALEGEGRPPAGSAPASARGAAAAAAATAERAEAEERTPAMDLDRLQELIRQTFRDEVRKLGGNLAKMGAEP
jgi:transcriptional regulator with XRE-family HTH domain